MRKDEIVHELRAANTTEMRQALEQVQRINEEYLDKTYSAAMSLWEMAKLVSDIVENEYAERTLGMTAREWVTTSLFDECNRPRTWSWAQNLCHQVKWCRRFPIIVRVLDNIKNTGVRVSLAAATRVAKLADDINIKAWSRKEAARTGKDAEEEEQTWFLKWLQKSSETVDAERKVVRDEKAAKEPGAKGDEEPEFVPGGVVDMGVIDSYDDVLEWLLKVTDHAEPAGTLSFVQKMELFAVGFADIRDAFASMKNGDSKPLSAILERL